MHNVIIMYMHINVIHHIMGGVTSHTLWVESQVTHYGWSHKSHIMGGVTSHTLWVESQVTHYGWSHKSHIMGGVM